MFWIIASTTQSEILSFKEYDREREIYNDVGRRRG
jgi:hypothetical protein